LLKVGGSTLHSVRITGPAGFEVEAYFAVFAGPGPKTAVLEIAPAIGSGLASTYGLSPSETTSFGVGELIQAALAHNVERLLILCEEDAGTLDGGAGMAQALGVRLLDARGHQIPWGGRALLKLVHIDLSRINPALRRVKIHCVDDRNFILCGPRGIAKILASSGQPFVLSDPLLSLALENYADVIQHELGIDVRTVPGGGAAGGLGAALYAFFDATLDAPASLSALRSA
jgi:glycerate kinase